MNDREFDKFLELLAAEIKREALEDIAEKEAHLDEIEMPEELDIATRALIREIAEEQAAAERAAAETAARGRRRRLADNVLRVAALVLVCLSVFNFVAMGVSEAYRERVFSIFESERHGAETLQENDGDENLMVRMSKEEWELLKDWEDFWYPMWLPEGFYLADAVDDHNRILKFESNSNLYSIVIMQVAGGAIATYDTDTTSKAAIEVGTYKGEIFVDESHNTVKVVWIAEDIIIRVNVEGYVDTELALKIAENMQFII